MDFWPAEQLLLAKRTLIVLCVSPAALAKGAGALGAVVVVARVLPSHSSQLALLLSTSITTHLPFLIPGIDEA